MKGRSPITSTRLRLLFHTPSLTSPATDLFPGKRSEERLSSSPTQMSAAFDSPVLRRSPQKSKNRRQPPPATCPRFAEGVRGRTADLITPRVLQDSADESCTSP
jgi:hypothetical protein